MSRVSSVLALFCVCVIVGVLCVTDVTTYVGCTVYYECRVVVMTAAGDIIAVIVATYVGIVVGGVAVCVYVLFTMSTLSLQFVVLLLLR